MELYNIGILEDFDFNKNTLIPSKDKPDKVFFVAIVSSHCGHCVKAKPDLQAFADSVGGFEKNYKNGSIVVCAIPTDNSKESVKKLSAKLKECIDNFTGGIPFFCAYKGGKQVGVFKGERTQQNFKKFCESM